MKNRTTILFILCLSFITAQAQQHTLKGKIVDRSSESEVPLYGAFVRWIDNEDGTYANLDGEFEIMHAGERPVLHVSSVGYRSDSFKVDKMDQFITLELIAGVQIEGATVSSSRITYGLSSKTGLTFELDEREFQKAACCNLSESFENAPAIDVSIADAVTGTKQIKMLGLDGFYTLISREYMPAARTLNSYYGLSLIPASWVNSIQITKGAGSIVNGYESIAGQINIEMKKPFDDTKFTFDQFVSQAGRSETDFLYRWDLNKYVATSAMARVAYHPGMRDNNSDGFMDMPSGNQFSLMNRWQFYTDYGVEGIVTASYVDDTKESGQQDFHTENNRALYGVEIDNEQIDLVAKIGKSFKDAPYKSFGSQFNVSKASHKSQYGSDANHRSYEANSTMYYANLMYQSIIGTTFHSFQSGFSFLGDVMEEQLDTHSFQREEWVPGAFFEYTYKPSDSFSIVAGIRADYNSIYGASITPRLHTKYRFNDERTSIRASAGLGRRTSNVLAQHQFILASQRRIEFLGQTDGGVYNMDQEVAVNAGLSLEHKFHIGYMPTTLITDYFHTSFMSEVVMDRETPTAVRLYSMENGTQSNSMQIQLDFKPMRRTEFRLAYRYFDVKMKYMYDPNPLIEYHDSYYTKDKPLLSKHRAFFNWTQKTRSRWQFSTTLQWQGKQRLPGSYDKIIDPAWPSIWQETSEYSDHYFVLNGQISKTLTSFPLELYIGVENLLNYQQAEPILEAEDPFNPYFDAGQVWGPIFGRMIYGGFRWRILQDYNDSLKQ
jgi:outer membrane receptor for ferrienterochelin and colicin